MLLMPRHRAGKLGSLPLNPVPQSHWYSWSHTGGLLSLPWPCQAVPAAWPGAAPQDAGAGMWEGLGESLGMCGFGPSTICFCLPTARADSELLLLFLVLPPWLGAGHGTGQCTGTGLMLLPCSQGGSCCKVPSVHLPTKQENPFIQGGFKMPRVMNLRPAPALLLCPAASDKAITALSLNCRV